MKRIAILVFGLAAMLGNATAGDDGMRTVDMPQAYRQECSACHVAYPPGLLPRTSWQRLMSNLPHHFGTDASLDEQAVKTLSTWLEANASRRAAEPAQDRITRGSWFLREHREVPADAWLRPAVRSASNCAACHVEAAKGNYSEHQVRIPR